MSKFRVGETVWTKPTEEIKATVGTYIPPVIAYFCNYQYIVNSIDECGRYILKEDERVVCFEFAEEWLESEKEHQMRVNTVKDESKVEENKMKFKDLKLGDMFTCSGPNIFIKTRFCIAEDDGRIAHICPIAGKDANFVDFVRLYDDDEVIPINVDVSKFCNEDIAVLATKALEHFGNEPQIRQTMEECAELIVALNKAMRYPEEMGWNVLEELADVTIMVEQMKQLYDVDLEFDDILKEKMNKLRNYLEEKTE